MEEELVALPPLRKWQHMTPEEQLQELVMVRHSRYFKRLSRKLQRQIDQVI